MVEVREPWWKAVAQGREAVLVVLGVGGAVAFGWAIDGVEVWRIGNPAVERVQAFGYWVFGVVFVVWFSLALRRVVAEWTGPAHRIVVRSRLEVASRNLAGGAASAVAFLIVLPALALLVDHRVWPRLLATVPFFAFGLYGLFYWSGMLVRDWRAGATLSSTPEHRR